MLLLLLFCLTSKVITLVSFGLSSLLAKTCTVHLLFEVNQIVDKYEDIVFFYEE